MNTVAERLVESWLDSQGERRYQPAFIQMLVSDGWTILHNTRHSPIELGKDVIARDPQGVLHCFQLKGNPGGRLTKSEASTLLTQFIELLELPVGREFRRKPTERHVAVFVTNGEIDEEARFLFNQAGERAGQPSVAAADYQIWARGEFLGRLMPAIRIWPANLEGMRLILELYAGDGEELPDPIMIGKIISSLQPQGPAPSAAAKTAALTSILLLAEVMKARWYAQENHYGLHMVTVLVSVAVLPLADSKQRLALVRHYASLALEHCRDLIDEAGRVGFQPDRTWFQSGGLDEFDIQWERRRLVADGAAIALLGRAAMDATTTQMAERLVSAVTDKPHLWGEGCIPSFIVASWARRTFDATIAAEAAIVRLTNSYLAINRGPDALPTPYYDFTDCWARYRGLPQATDEDIFEDSFRGHSTFGHILLLLLARRNLKASCARLWPAYSRLVHDEPSLPDLAFFSPIYSQDGQMISRTVHLGVWHDIVADAVDREDVPSLSDFDSLAWLVAAYISIVPYRAWPNIIMWLDGQLASTWYHRLYPRPSY